MKKKKKRNYFSSLSLGYIVWNNKKWWAWLGRNSKANKARTNTECSADQQLNHHRWKKHTVYPKKDKEKKIAITHCWRSYGFHSWQYILNTCLNILGTSIVITHDKCIVLWILFSETHFWTWAPVITVSALWNPSLRKQKHKKHFVCLQSMFYIVF